jgi:biotin synthase-related radical SAM superfamily protein
MEWKELKAQLLEAGTVRVIGEPVDQFLGHSTAGPSAGGSGSLFFSLGGRRVRLAIKSDSPIVILHTGDGDAILRTGDLEIRGRLEPVALHCPRQAFITLSERCIYSCRYCQVPMQKGRIKSAEEVRDLVASVRDRIDAISLTSGVADTIEEEERRVLHTLGFLRDTGLPMGVSIYPNRETPRRLKEAGVDEVKFNLEAATEDLLEEMCPGLGWQLMWDVLDRSVEIFGAGRVFSNVIIGLGESDAEMETCIDRLASRGVIPVLRPLNPAASLSGYRRPSAARLLHLAEVHRRALKKAGLDTRIAQTMCTACTGCDLVPGRDL